MRVIFWGTFSYIFSVDCYNDPMSIHSYSSVLSPFLIHSLKAHNFTQTFFWQHDYFDLHFCEFFMTSRYKKYVLPVLTAWKIVLFIISSLDSMWFNPNFIYIGVNQKWITKANWRYIWVKQNQNLTPLYIIHIHLIAFFEVRDRFEFWSSNIVIFFPDNKPNQTKKNYGKLQTEPISKFPYYYHAVILPSSLTSEIDSVLCILYSLN